MIEYITSEIIAKSLQNNSRQYLAGDLKLPQELEYIYDENVEAGITRYTQYAVEQPHIHSKTTEYTYVIAGETKYVDLKTRREYYFKQGDFFIVRNNTASAQKSLPGTVLLAIKAPAGNDKICIEVNEELEDWYKDWEKEFVEEQNG